MAGGIEGDGMTNLLLALSALEIILLLAVSALIGFALGTSFSWFAIAASSVGTAVLSSMILQIHGFSSLPGIAVVVACLTINQMAYLTRPSWLFEEQADKEPSQDSDSDSEIAYSNH
jgi:hypothetical protein